MVPRRKVRGALHFRGQAGRVAANRQVVDLRVRPWQQVVVELVVVGLDRVVGVVAALANDQELGPPRPPERPVEAVVGRVRRDGVLDVCRAAEPLERVVAVHVDLHELVGAATADALECDAIELVVRAELDAGVLDSHVAQRAAVVVRVVAAVDAGVGLAHAFAALDVHRRAAVDDEAAPVTAVAAADRLVAGEDDGLLPRADRIQTAAAQHDERADAAGLADHAGAGLDVQGRPGGDEDRAAEHVIEVVGPVLGAGDVARSRRSPVCRCPEQ